MGCAGGCAKEKRQEAEALDPRWDLAGFDAACNRLQWGWGRVKFLRQTAKAGRALPKRQDLPPEALHVGAPPPLVQLYAVSHIWITLEHPDPDALHLLALVAALDRDGAHDEDLVSWDWISHHQYSHKKTKPPTVVERSWRKLYSEMLGQMCLHFRLKMVVLPDLPPTITTRSSYFERGWCMREFGLASFTQRIVNQHHPEVAAHMTPEWLAHLRAKLETEAEFSSPKARSTCLAQYRQLTAQMVHARNDALGFQTVCRVANFRWVFVSFVHELAARGGPAPRRQDLPPGVYVDGAVPTGCQPWVVSYGWAAVCHFSPSGAKVREVSSTLAELGAKPTDVVWLDYLSLWQRGHEVPEVYASQNACALTESLADGRVKQNDLTPEQKQEARFALYETSRLYAFAGGRLPGGQPVLGCKVLVLPMLEDPSCFPDHGEIRAGMNTFCTPPREELDSRWGFAKSIPYERGGWTCTEYSVARRNGTIANGDSPDVQRIERARDWPHTIAEFAEMMDEGSRCPVHFTKNGDREVVRFNFYKYSYHIQEELE